MLNNLQRLICHKTQPTNNQLFSLQAQFARAAKYTNCICWGVRPRPLPLQVSWYDIELSDAEAPVMMELSRMMITPLLSTLPGPPWPRAVAPNWILSMDRIELFDI